MWIRSAYWIGEARLGQEETFRAAINGELIPLLRTLPGVRAARAIWPRRVEANAPHIACQFLIEYNSVEDIDLMLASPERAAMRAEVPRIIALFDGQISHIDFEVA